RDLFAAPRTRVFGIEPARANRIAELKFRLIEQLIENCKNFVVGHKWLSDYKLATNIMITLNQAIRPTTFIESAKLRDRLGLDVTIATETFQHTGSFKFRAAYNLALNVPNDEILTASSGNFGQ